MQRPTDIPFQRRVAARPTRDVLERPASSVRAHLSVRASTVPSADTYGDSDFPRGEGESRMVGRGTLDDLLPGHPDARRVLGFEPFAYESCANEGERRAVAAANEILGFAA